MATINLGAIKFKWQGTYNAGTAYTVDDVVSYNGSSWICILASTGNLPTNATYWEQMAQGSDLGSISGLAQGDIIYYDGSNFQRLGAGTSGDFLKTQGTGANPVWASAGGGLQSQQVFTSSGTYTKPSGITRIKVIVTGAGGGGGGGTGNYNRGGGGGAGGTAIEIIDATSITTETVTVGTGGSGGATGVDGGSGGTSSFGSYCSGTGGQGGKHATSVNSGQGEGGLGSGGDINIRGGHGGEHGAHSAQDQAGGGHGGASYWGGGSRPASDWTNNSAESISAFGTGGGGGAHDNFSGATGLDGIVVIEEYK